ncbi:type II toxin-antitoxin system RelE/ParE family toxin [Nitrosomonas sp. Nm58]|uniref:type II toxin-antitoxin system RelE/ParE family toxin n=1 Tax=Nitrosomonas sp. Nm58 TaxID=200126 RepID=UPI00089AE081|nr:type II toxin-antitoxin system RelE/ParE family toxin [Nitrosomonas sp. Nm58]SDY63850.1 proteic killer suppression protein [Nitrosomonas sp. Nm58]
MTLYDCVHEQNFRHERNGSFVCQREDQATPPEILQVACRKLAQLHRVSSIEELRIPPGNRLEKLSCNRDGQWSIRINNQWRICFRFEAGDAFDVEITDYH